MTLALKKNNYYSCKSNEPTHSYLYYASLELFEEITVTATSQDDADNLAKQRFEQLRNSTSTELKVGLSWLERESGYALDVL